MARKVGLIGMGVISKFYVHAMRNEAGLPQLAAVCDLNLERIAAFQEEGLHAYRDYRELLRQQNLDAVIVNVPNDKHYEICREAMLAGKHVCCEKPMALTLQEAGELAAWSRSTGKTLFTAFHRRYNVHFQQALERISTRDEIASVEARYLEKIEEHAGEDRWYLDPARCGGGCIADNGPNVYDTLAFFLGRLDVVSADISWTGQADTEARVELVSETGVPVSVHLDWAYPHGEKKEVLIRLKDGTELNVDMLAGFEAFKSSLYHEYAEILRDFDAKIEAGGCHGEDGLDAVRLVRDTYLAETVRS
ncbi:Gfo/Idh/MocA family protein [Paenibacillus pasadenensis]|uniref:Oxidoreductase domain protein n=1 Tax=Paenibacillus pasadenensis TaxID=217090 RepID=A0A2N5N2Y8_9BACL|nr:MULTISPECIES: Gfo/Idh/MocA family oxidoreductase [Paenibacillus]PLT44690.1 oxidoreductase domain protein [Paenibacillus pasadenensis]QGG55165.1 gfo/Idh/MocA family oxidoreductase [Paenibacillus sp. B01]